MKPKRIAQAMVCATSLTAGCPAEVIVSPLDPEQQEFVDGQIELADVQVPIVLDLLLRSEPEQPLDKAELIEHAQSGLRSLPAMSAEGRIQAYDPSLLPPDNIARYASGFFVRHNHSTTDDNMMYLNLMGPNGRPVSYWYGWNLGVLMHEQYHEYGGHSAAVNEFVTSDENHGVAWGRQVLSDKDEADIWTIFSDPVFKPIANAMTDAEFRVETERETITNPDIQRSSADVIRRLRHDMDEYPSEEEWLEDVFVSIDTEALGVVYGLDNATIGEVLHDHGYYEYVRDHARDYYEGAIAELQREAAEHREPRRRLPMR